MRKWAAVLALVVAGGLSVAGGRAAADDPGVAFADQEALSPSQEDLNDGVTVSVCNSAGTAATVTMRLEGFQFTQTDDDGSAVPVGNEKVVTVDPSSSPIETGTCVDFDLMSAGEGVELAAASYEGSLVAVSNGAGIARLALTLPGTSAATKPDAALGDVDLHGHFNGWWDTRGTASANEGITLRFTGDNPPPSINKDEELGVLASGSDSARLLAAGDSETVNGVLEVDVKLVGASGNGTYVGQLDPAIAGSDDKPISVTMAVADHWLWALVACLVGVVVGVLAKYAGGRWRVLAQWKSFRDGFESKYSDADKTFEAGYPGVALRFRGPTPDTVNTKKEELAKRAETYRTTKSWQLFDTTSKAHTAIADSYAAVGDDIRRLGSESDDGLGAAIAALDKRIDEFITTFNKNFPTHEPPRILGTAKGVAGYKGTATPRAQREDAKELPVGGAAKLVADATAAVSMLDTWELSANRFRRCRMWAFLLRVPAPSDPALDVLAERIRELDLELFDSVTSDDLKTAEVDSDLDRVYRRLAVLGGRYNVYLPSDWEDQDRNTECSRAGGASIVYVNGPGGIDALALAEVKTLVEAIPPPPIIVPSQASEQWTAIDTGTAVVLEVLIGLGAALTLFVAVRNLYVDKPFGSFGDYLAVFGLGVAAELVVSWFIQAANGWRAPMEAPEAKAT
jgi:hypothetical protein